MYVDLVKHLYEFFEVKASPLLLNQAVRVYIPTENTVSKQNKALAELEKVH
jgi:hypothetical protein